MSISSPPPFNAECEVRHLKELLTQRLDLRDQRFTQEAEAMTLRLDTMNQFRDQLREQAGTFVTREEVQLMAHTRDEAIQRLETRAANLDGRLWVIGAIVTLAVTALGAFPHLFK